ncbi:hypothetical protein HN446_01120 [bacterium]|nr:hypothetical protein [bacterium]
MSCKKLLLICSTLFFSWSVSPLTLLKGDLEDSTTNSFSFGVGPTVAVSTGAFTTQDYFIVGSNAALTGDAQKYAVSVIGPGDEFIPAAPATVTLNGDADESNPLYGEQISLISNFGDKILTVTQGDPKAICMINTSVSSISDDGTISVITSERLRDAQGESTNITGGIIALDTGITSTAGTGNVNYIFAAVKDSADNFGSNNSGIAMLSLGGSSSLISTITQLDAYDVSGGDGKTRAVPLSPSINALKIGSNLSSIAEHADLHWDSRLERLYIALDVTGALAPTSGAISVVVGRPDCTKNKLYFDLIALPDCFDGSNRVVGKTGVWAQTNMRKVRTMHTSTMLSYLVCVQRSGEVDSVYALPLVDLQPELGRDGVGDKKHGTIAKIDTTTNTDIYEKWYSETTMIDRAFTTTAQSVGDIPATSDVRVKIGGDGSLPQTATGHTHITDIVINGDSVYVSIGEDGAALAAGIFYSQAIFDECGRVRAWTNWRRVCGSAANTFSFATVSEGNFLFGSGTSENSVNTFKRTDWAQENQDGLLGGTTSDGSIGLVAQLEQDLSSECGGIQGLFDFSRSTPGFTDVAASKISMMVATGYKKVVLLETGRSVASVYTPDTGDFATTKKTYDEAKIKLTDSPVGTTKIMSFSGGVLDDLGPITQAEVAKAGNKAWLFAGGVGGLAVLCAANGDGWAAATGYGLKLGFEGINLVGGVDTEVQFREVGDYSYIKKIVSDGNFLYVLTNNKLDRIDLTSVDLSNFDSTADVVTLANTETFFGNSTFDCFSDLIISGNFALLATSNGLYRVGNGNNISTETSEDDVSWALVDVPDGLPTILQLFAVCPTGRAQDCTGADMYSQLYVLSAYSGYDQARVNRFLLSDSSGGIVDDTIKPLESDSFVNGTNSFFINYGLFRDSFATDGAMYFAQRSKDGSAGPLVQALASGYTCGKMYLIKKAYNLSLGLSDANTIGKIVRNSASGAWIVNGDFGLKVNE